MTINMWLAGACGMAAGFGFFADLRNEERLVRFVLISALWPIALAMGFGQFLRDAFKPAGERA